jgi:hydroxyethylthiazole kinase-like uncharacterized protein yjeF
MRRLEDGAERLGLPGPALMEIAGRAVADELAGLYSPIAGKRVVVLVGPGNNGGDGMVAARWLAAVGARVIVSPVGRPERPDAKIELLADRGVPIARSPEAALLGADVVVDGLLGIGRARPIGGAMADALADAGRCGAPIVALDLPTGLNADTGAADPATPRCAATITLGAVKRGLLIGDGPRVAGLIRPIEIGVPRSLAAALPVDWIAADLAGTLLPERDPTGHKGTFGRLLIVAGAPQYVGAPMLAALGAARAGAGLVTIAGPPEVVRSAAVRMPEATFLRRDAIEEAAAEYRALVLGPGLGRADETVAFLSAAMESPALRALPWVIDADALTLLSRMDGWTGRLPPRTVLTPHAGEMARLLGVEHVPADRIESAVASAKQWRATVVLKGAYTVVARPDGRAAVSPSANPALATAGTGDVLAGAIGGLIAQGADAADAAVVGVALHGAAGELARAALGRGGVLASDVADRLPEAAELLRSGRTPWR